MTSAVQVPVALALAKLALVFAVKNLEELKILIGEELSTWGNLIPDFIRSESFWVGSDCRPNLI